MQYHTEITWLHVLWCQTGSPHHLPFSWETIVQVFISTWFRNITRKICCGEIVGMGEKGFCNITFNVWSLFNLFVYWHLFNDEICNSHYLTPNDRIIIEKWMGKSVQVRVCEFISSIIAWRDWIKLCKTAGRRFYPVSSQMQSILTQEHFVFEQNF